MRLSFPSRLVPSALVCLFAILVVSEPSAKASNGSKKGRLQVAKLETWGQQNNGSTPELRESNPKMADTDTLLRTLDQEMATKDLPRSFWSLLSYLSEKVAAKGKGMELPFFVDIRLFSKDVRAVLDGELPPPLLKFPPLPSRMTVRAILQMALEQFDGDQATFLIRQRRVEIITKKAAARENLLKQTFAASFNQQPLEFVLDELSEITGVSVILDGRAKDKTRTPITARFRNDVPLLEALRMVTESVGLKLVEFPGGSSSGRALFVTTPEHAQSLQR